MSEDLKAKFRAAAAQRGLNSAKDQLKAIKAQKAATASAAGAGPSSQRLQQQQLQPKPTTAGATTAPNARPAGGGALPSDFFQQASKEHAPAPSTAAAAPAPAVPAAAALAKVTTATAAPGPSSQALAQRPYSSAAAAGSAAPGAAAGPSSALPEGFFTDKAADAQARGVKLPTAADREAEFRAFTAVIDEELKQQAVEEAEEAEAEAEEKADREAFRLRQQQQRLELLRRRKALLLAKSTARDADEGAQLPELPPDDELREAPPPAFGSDEEGDGEEDEGRQMGEESEGAGTSILEAGGAAGKRPRRALPMLPGKRRRVIDALAATLAASDGEGSSGGESGEGKDSDGESGGALNWRAKRV